MSDERFKKIVALCKECGFVYPSSEIYDGLSAIYDYGPNGVLLKNNIKEYWWKAMVQMHENIVGLDSAIFMHPKIWKASGHVDQFTDFMLDNKKSNKRYRADHLIEGALSKIQEKLDKEVEKAQKKFAPNFDEALYRQTNPRVLEYAKKIETYQARLDEAMKSENLTELDAIIKELEIACEVSGSREWTEVKKFNLMFSTQGGGATSDDKLYLRPETAQGIFVNFENVYKTMRQKIPFGIAQIGKAFRNEVVARQFIFRMREFEQMEMQFFVRPGDGLKFYEYWKERRLRWHLALGTNPDMLRFHNHIQLAHYADAALDIEFEFPFGFKELEGIHSRTDFDLSQHQEFSGKKLQYFDAELNERYIPHVVETSVGCDRMFLAVLTQAYTEELAPTADGKEEMRVVLKLAPALAPVKCAVLPLLKNNEELVAKAREVFNALKFSFNCFYDEKDAIGRRYRRQDEIGTPYCLTIDHQTLEDNTVTIRERDTMRQERISIAEAEKIVSERISWSHLLNKL